MTDRDAPTRARQSFEAWAGFLPRWWLVLAWLAMLAGTVASVHQGRWGLDVATTRILAGGLFAASAAAAQLLRRRPPDHASALALTIATVGGLAATLAAPAGLGEVPVYLSAARIPYALGARDARWFVVADTIATGLVVGYVSHSVAGLLAGIGVPFLAQRAVDQRTLVEQRDHARALLAELEAGRDAQDQAAALRERGRIAREMHDVLAHSLAGLSLQLQAARAVAQKRGADPAVLEPIDRAAALARDGLAEARSAVGTLTEPVLRGLAELPELVAHHPGSATLTADGAALTLPPRAGHAVYRAVQESLTNAARYAPGSPVRVTLSWHAAGLLVRVDDDGAAPGHSPLTGQGSGLGLRGMSERLGAVGGTVRVGPQGIGWRVAISVPAGDGDGDLP